MARITLLEIVQQILTEADGDDVNSITDTVESDQCARVVRDAYDYIIDVHDVKHFNTLTQLNATSGTTPNVMTRPAGHHTIEWVKYDKRVAAGDAAKFQDVDYLPVYDFLDRIMSRSTDDSNVDSITLSTGLSIPVRNDQAPTYYTIMDDGMDELVFDSYDSNLETNLQASKSMTYGVQEPTMTLADNSTMLLSQDLESLVISEARAMYFDLYKDGVTQEVDRRRRRTEVRAQRQRYVTKNTDNDNRPDYGRK